MNAQAQDRGHRIGPQNPVPIFRLVSVHTVETKIMQCAREKRKLKALVIAKGSLLPIQSIYREYLTFSTGKFKMPSAAASTKRETIAEMAASLLRLEGEKIEVVPNTKEGKQSDQDLDILLDRSPGVFTDRGSGWSSKASHRLSAVAGEAASSTSTLEPEVESHATLLGGKKVAFALYEIPKTRGMIMGGPEAE